MRAEERTLFQVKDIIEEDPFVETVIGSYVLGSVHIVEMKADPVSNQFDLTVSDGNGSTLASTTFPMANYDEDGIPLFPVTRLYLNVDSAGGYIIDSIRMYEQ